MPWEGVRLFVAALTSLAPQAVFTAANVVTWAEKYYAGKSVSVPHYLQSANKLALLLKNYAAVLQLSENQNGKGFMVR